MRTVLPAALYMMAPVELRDMSDMDISPGGHVTCLGTLLLPVAPPSSVSPADLHHTQHIILTIGIHVTFTPTSPQWTYRNRGFS